MKLTKSKLKSKSSAKVKTKRKECTFQHIPHWDDPEIGYKALLKCIKSYVKYKSDEFDRLAPVITRDEFIWDTFSNMARRDGWPQYDKEKNKGNFYSFVQTCCVRNQADWARKRNTKFKQLAELQGQTLGTDYKGCPEYIPILNLDATVEDSDDQLLHEKIEGSRQGYYTEDLALQELTEDISDTQISEKFWLTWKQFAGLLMKGWSVIDISQELHVNPTTTRKYYGQLKEKLLADKKIASMLEDYHISKK